MKTKFAIVISEQDKAGMNIAKHLDELGVDYVLIKKNTISSEKELGGSSAVAESDFVIFATKHRSEKEMKSLTVHAPGNFGGGADFGGVGGRVCKTSGVFLKYLFSVLSDEALKQGIVGDGKYEVSLECTHHGPLIDKPCCFIEIGGSEKEWVDGSAGEVIANVIKRAINNLFISFGEENKEWEAVIGVGGPHYCPNFNKIQLNTNYAISHIIPQYNFPISEEIIKEAINKTIDPLGVKKAIIDWKGCGKSAERGEVIKILEKCGLEVIRTDKVDKD